VTEVSGAPGRRPNDADWWTLVIYGMPLSGCMVVAFLLSTYWFKYATEVLLVSPAILSAIFMAGRLWDAVSDPLTGYLSDRTRARMGRRRPWMMAAVLPIAVVPILIWVPPSSLQGWALIAWLTVGLLAFETVLTVFLVPHGALGTELVLDHHARTRVFTVRVIFSQLGVFLAILAMGLLIAAEDPRAMALRVLAAGGLVSAVLIFVSTLLLRERPEYQQRGATRPLPALADVWKNPHARLLLSVFLIESMGTATLGVMGPFVTKYIVGDESIFPYQVGAYLVPALAMAPVAPWLSRKLGKKRTWLIAMVIAGTGFGLLTFVGPGEVIYLCSCSALSGIGTGIGGVVGASLQADIVDYDEFLTGERKEGVYFATWNFMRKAGSGVVVFLAGLTLTWIGFEANVAEQTQLAKTGMLLMFGGVPFVGFVIGVTLFARFNLTEAEHRRIRDALDHPG
jgi:GPH family glycoside/pentoside/hexuronide:cation symporter